MNLYWENDKSLTSRTPVLPKGEATTVASNIIRPRQELLEATRINYGYKEMDTCRRPNARVTSYPIYPHKCINKEKAHGRESADGNLDSRQNLSTRVISDRPPSQPRRCRRVSLEPSSVSVKERRKDPGAGEAHHLGRFDLKRLQQSDSKWSSGSGALTDRPPLQPFIRHGISEASRASAKGYQGDPILEEPRPESSIKRLQQSNDSRWSSGYRSSFDLSPFEALAGSSIRSLDLSDDSSWSSSYRTT
jgi:hypothetical protein